MPLDALDGRCAEILPVDELMRAADQRRTSTLAAYPGLGTFVRNGGIFNGNGCFITDAHDKGDVIEDF